MVLDKTEFFMNKHTIKIRILIPLILSLTALLIVFVFDIYQSRQKDITSELEKKIKAVPDVLETELKDLDAENYTK